MKGILGAGIISLVIGGGLGYAGGSAIFKPAAVVTGACQTLDTAVKTGVLNVQQARQLGANAAKANPSVTAEASRSWVSFGDDGSACQEFLQALRTK